MEEGLMFFVGISIFVAIFIAVSTIVTNHELEKEKEKIEQRVCDNEIKMLRLMSQRIKDKEDHE